MQKKIDRNIVEMTKSFNFYALVLKVYKNMQWQ